MATAKRRPTHDYTARGDLVDGRLEALMAARQDWINEASEAVQRHGFVDAAWLVGSLGSGTADVYSDVDLVVAVDETRPAEVFADPVACLGLPGRVLYTRPKPRNAPAGGGYLAVCVQLAGLPVLIDLYLWPSATAAVPSGGTVLFSRTRIPHTDLGFMPLLDQNRTSQTGDTDGDCATTTLLLAQLAAKYHARADQPRYAAMAARLHLSNTCGIRELRQTVHPRVDGAARADLNDAIRTTRTVLMSMLKDAGVDPNEMTTITIRATIDAFRRFAALPVEDAARTEEDGDAFLAQYGTYGFRGRREFSADLTRQFVEAGDEHGPMWQLSCTLHWAPSAATEALASGRLWSYGKTVDGFFAEGLALPGWAWALDGIRAPHDLSITFEQI